MSKIQEDEFYLENGLFVFTERFHLRRGRCCGSGCRHCPFEHAGVPIEKRTGLAQPCRYFSEEITISPP